MLKSMTGFGRFELMDENRKIIVEMKSVNHRYCDINIKMPKKLNFFESAMRSLIKKYAERGKIDVFITYEDYTEHNLCLKYNEELAGEYYNNIVRMSEKFGLENDVRAYALSRYPEVLTLEEQTVDEDELWRILEKALTGACERFVNTRIAEGENCVGISLISWTGLSLWSIILTRDPRPLSRNTRKNWKLKFVSCSAMWRWMKADF